MALKIARQAMYVRINVTLRRVQHAIRRQHAMRRHHIDICRLSGSTVFFHIVSYTHDFRNKKMLWNIKCVTWFSLQVLCETLLILRRNKRKREKEWWSHMYIDLHVKCPLFLSNFNETLTFSKNFRKTSKNIKFHKNSSKGSRVIPCGRTDGQKYGQTDRQTWQN